MNDPGNREQVAVAIRGVLAELGVVTPAMIEAGSLASHDVQMTRDDQGKPIFRPGVTEDKILVAVCNAMLAAKLAELG